MSEHDVEDLVHGSIVALDRHFPDDDRLRDWFTALYEFQSGHDCSHTQHRVMEILIRCGHTIRVPVTEHPDWRRMAGPDAAGPRPVRLLDVVVAVAGAAERDGDVDLIAGWWALGHQALVGGCPLSPEELSETPGVEELRAIVRRTGAHLVELRDGYRPSDDDLTRMDDELESWWYRLD
jgi:hypothetical protein